MVRHERWTAIVSAGLIFGALLACKKKGTDTAAEASASAAVVVPPPPAPAQTAAPAEGLKLGDVKRYNDKEKKSDEGAVRVLAEDIKVFNEADSKTPEVATLPKDLLVFRISEVEGFQLVEFPSGVGQFSQGWVEKKGLSPNPEKVAREVVLSDKKVAQVKTDGGAPAPKASGSASGSGSAKLAASVSASVAPALPTPPKPDESDAEKRAADAEKRAADAEKKAKEAEKKAKAAEKKAREAEKKATAK